MPSAFLQNGRRWQAYYASTGTERQPSSEAYFSKKKWGWTKVLHSTTAPSTTRHFRRFRAARFWEEPLVFSDRGGTGADPKERLGEFRMYEDAILQLALGKRNAAIAALERILAADPQNTLARRDLGACYLEQGAFEKARVELKVSEAAPDGYATQYQLGLSYKKLGLSGPAIEHIRTTCSLAPEAGQCKKTLAELTGPN